jgi:dTMP kinase
LEGIEGSGKTTQSARLADWLGREGYEVIRTREPGGTPLAESLRQSLLDTTNEPVTPWTEVLLVLAARAQHVVHVIRPALERGAIVLCDRYIDSTLAYQAYGRGLPPAMLLRLHRQVTDNAMPDLTLLFDLPVKIGLRRRRQATGKANRLDGETNQFHERVRQGFRDLALKHASRIRMIPSGGTSEQVHTHVKRILMTVLARRKDTLARQVPASTVSPQVMGAHAVR